MTDEKPEKEPPERPRYGELAPEGWTWKPPPDALGPDGTRVGRDAPEDREPRLSRPQPPFRPQPPAWDRAVTALLLVIGLFGVFLSVGILAALPDSIQMLHAQDGLGDYSPADSVPALILAGQIVQGVVWILAAAGSVLLLARGRRAFYVPVLGGVLAGILLFVFIGVIASSDTVLLDYYSQLG